MAGKSLLFLIVILVGYIAGIIHKLLYAFDFVIILYGCNFLMVAIDIILYLRNRLFHLKQSAQESSTIRADGRIH